MNSKISEILKDIANKKKELLKEYEKLKDKYGFTILKGKIIFKSDIAKRNKLFKENLFRYILSARVRHLLSAPFIYAMIIPTIILDIFLFVYQQICFRLYDIPFVKRSDYVTLDRKALDYLNVIQKFNCLYCSYVNGIFSYAVEIGGRTEKYWCPIKYAKKMKGGHDWQEYFADFGDPEGFKDAFNKNHEFNRLKK